MNAFLRQIAALSVLWALCELLMPEGGMSRMARLIVSLLVMTVLLTTLVSALGQWTGAETDTLALSLGNAAGDSAALAQERGKAAYVQAYLRSQANQAEDVCVRMARGAGYAAQAAVYLQQDGELDRIELHIQKPREGSVALLSTEELKDRIVVAFGTDASRIRITIGEGESE